MYLVSIKPKDPDKQGSLYVVGLSSLPDFIDKHLSSDVVLLIDTIDTYTADL